MPRTAKDFTTNVLDIMFPLLHDQFLVLCLERDGAFTRPPASSSHSRIFKTLAANDSTSFSVSPGATAAKTRIPFPTEEISCLSTVTEADSTRWRIAGNRLLALIVN